MAAAKKDKVMELVERQLRRNPQASVQELFNQAKKASPSVGSLSLRQFHAKYPLQVKRRMAPKKRRPARKRAARRRAPSPPATDPRRDVVREGLLTFAKDISAAPGKAETIDILAKVDRYVDDVLKGL